MMQRKGTRLDISTGKTGFMGKLREHFASFREHRERFREHGRRQRESGAAAVQAQRLMQGVVLCQAPTQLYIITQYAVSFVLGDYDSWAIYYMKVLCWFVMTSGMANWFLVVLYDPSVQKSRDRPDLARVANHQDNPPDQFVPMIQEAVSQQNGSVVYDMTEKEGLPWEFCDECQMHIPPRAHHCKFCKKCILKRDHHCFMLGNCIGFKNQRYFIVLAFYAMLGGVVFGIFQFKYLKDAFWPVAEDWKDFLIPVTIYRWLFRSIPGHVCLTVVHLYMDVISFGLGWMYFSSQMNIAMNGLTLYEVAKKVPIKNTNSPGYNLRSVFGDLWGLNFIFPMAIILRQQGDGLHWDGVKLYHSGDEKKGDDDEVNLR